MKLRPVISTTLHSHYLISALIACDIWSIAFGHSPILYVCVPPGDRDDPRLPDSELSRIMDDARCETHFVTSPLGIQPCNVAQVSRLFAAHHSRSADDDILLTTDADMLPVDAQWTRLVSEPPEDGFVTIGYDAYRPAKRLPMCYIAARAATWRKHFRAVPMTMADCCREVIRSMTGSEEVKRWQGWEVDEALAGQIVLALPPDRVRHIERKYPNGMADWRMDRANSGESWAYQEGMWDAHLPRPLSDTGPWQSLQRLLHGFDQEIQSRADCYRARIMLLLGDRDPLV